MSNPKAAANDPSMDDILASIRKIISDDDARSKAGMTSTGSSSDAQDVLLLTNPVDGNEADGISRAVSPSIGDSDSDTVISILQRLNEAVEDPTPVQAPMSGLTLGDGQKTIEDMVNEMLRPMLKEWIDQNLPSMVQAIVQREATQSPRR